jgi:hypothetical protein
MIKIKCTPRSCDVRDFRTGCVETDYGIEHEHRDESDDVREIRDSGGTEDSSSRRSWGKCVTAIPGRRVL